jgi:UDP-N-acetylmuramyl pentapeptide phosphotransferase/UDP-N-acetylglucosamine-1-phosphate transferase
MPTNESLMLYLLFLIAGFAVAFAYKFAAVKFNIVDTPNHRSLHVTPTIRGGGIIFPLLLVPALLLQYSFSSIALSISLFAIAVISFWDDLSPRTPFQRFAVHIVLAVFWAWYLRDLIPWWAAVILVAFFIGFLNAYNFMDGINGITVLYTAAIWVLLRLFETDWLLSQWGEYTIIAMDVALLVFAFFNVRIKAAFFAGDVGALSVALFVAVNLCLLIARDQSLHWVGLVVLYGIDSGWTIIKRLRNHEKIWEPHKKHIFQQLVYNFGWSHLAVSFTYAIIQFSVGATILYAADAYGHRQATLLFIASLLLFTTIYFLLIRRARILR